MPSYQQLIRDKIPEIIEAAGKKPVTHIRAMDEYLSVWKHLTADEKAEILQICDEKLDAYFQKL